MSVEQLILKDSTVIEDYSNLIWFLGVVDVKMWEVLDFPGIGLQFLWWDETGTVLVKDLLHELSVMF